MRRTLTTVSAVALTLALGACDKQQASSPEPEANKEQPAGQQGGVFENLAELASGASSSMQGKETVTITTKMTGGPGGNIGDLTCQVDLAEKKQACSGAAEMVLADNTMYMKTGMDPAKPWTKSDLGPNAMAAGMDSIEKYTDINKLLPAGTVIENQSPDTVDGQQATKYETVTDMKKAAAEATDPAQKSLLDLAVKAGVTEQRQTIWIGSDSLPVQAETRSPAREIMGRQVPETTTNIKFKDWGKPVTINVPSPDQVSEGSPIPGMGG